MATVTGYRYDRFGERVEEEADDADVAEAADPSRCEFGRPIAADRTCCIRHDASPRGVPMRLAPRRPA